VRLPTSLEGRLGKFASILCGAVMTLRTSIWWSFRIFFKFSRRSTSTFLLTAGRVNTSSRNAEVLVPGSNEYWSGRTAKYPCPAGACRICFKQNNRRVFEAVSKEGQAVPYRRARSLRSWLPLVETIGRSLPSGHTSYVAVRRASGRRLGQGFCSLRFTIIHPVSFLSSRLARGFDRMAPRLKATTRCNVYDMLVAEKLKVAKACHDPIPRARQYRKRRKGYHHRVASLRHGSAIISSAHRHRKALTCYVLARSSKPPPFFIGHIILLSSAATSVDVKQTI